MKKKSSIKQKGITLVELIVVFGVLMVVCLLFVQAIRWVKDSSRSSEKARILAKFKNASFILSRELSCASEFLYPNKIGGVPSNVLIFKNFDNEISLLYLGKDGLNLFNYQKNEVKNLFTEAVSLKTTLIQDNYIEYEVELRGKDNQFVLKNKLTTLNSLP
ncbi:MAG: type II secretion system protein [Candidatus Riflebacteria bacterium]|nr:type II secretion system protein [Candidatus Riflebacteria bacterium]